MQICAPGRRFLLAALIVFGHLALLVAFGAVQAHAQEQPAATTGQRLVESVDIQGNRRNRDEDLLYYVTTRAGDQYNEAQVQRDFKALMDLGFFNKVESRVLTGNGRAAASK